MRRLHLAGAPQIQSRRSLSKTIVPGQGAPASHFNQPEQLPTGASGLKVTVTDTEVQFQKNNRTRRVPREQIRVAFLDGKDIVLQAADSRELARKRHDQRKSEAKRIPTAFEAHGYPWSAEGDRTATPSAAGWRTTRRSRRR
jgi:hypothetical protein